MFVEDILYNFLYGLCIKLNVLYYYYLKYLLIQTEINK